MGAIIRAQLYRDATTCDQNDIRGQIRVNGDFLARLVVSTKHLLPQRQQIPLGGCPQSDRQNASADT
jgi:hypothetical protein